MGSHDLKPHPAFPMGPLSGLKGGLQRPGNSEIVATFAGVGAADRVQIPVSQTPGRRDDLWRTTCFEVFLAGPDGGYVEFNFSPSGDWAAYRFRAYRADRIDLATRPPQIEFWRTTDRLDLAARFYFDAADWRAGLSAVIETVDGEKSYWAISHSGDKPDFHHPGGFVDL